MKKKLIATAAGLLMLGGTILPASAANAAPPVSGAPAPTYYVSDRACKTGYHTVLQHWWWNWFQTRTVCARSGENVPLWYF